MIIQYITLNTVLQTQTLLHHNLESEQILSRVQARHSKSKTLSRTNCDTNHTTKHQNANMQARYILAGVGALGAGALVLSTMGTYSSDRQYQKTLQYMHDGRENFQKKMDDASAKVKDVKADASAKLKNAQNSVNEAVSGKK